jgi:hypothetical protein
MQRANFDRIVFISIVNETEVRFQFGDDELFPRRLGINLVYSDGLLSRIAVDDHYSVEETQK